MADLSALGHNVDSVFDKGSNCFSIGSISTFASRLFGINENTEYSSITNLDGGFEPLISSEPKRSPCNFYSARWWHATRIHGPSISLGKVQLNGQNWDLFSGEVEAFWKGGHPWLARAARTYLSALGPLMTLQERLK